jgi:acyl phosphate:glycerol-3-phosphate acyltransferase
MIILGIVISYLLGSISSSTLITRAVAKVDIRDHGSGNAGATNTLRVIGMKWGIVVLLLDALKGVIGVSITYFLVPHSLTALCLSGIAAICGHNWPVFFKFRGGKGIATTIGVLLVITPMPALFAIAVAVITILLTRFVSLGALLLTILTPIFVAILQGHQFERIAFGCLVAILSIIQHRQNIRRLFRGQENRIFSRKS